MGSFSIWHWLIVLLIVVLIFGTKKLQEHRHRPRRRGQGLQGRHEGRHGVTAPTRRRRRSRSRDQQAPADAEHGRRRGEDQVLNRARRPRASASRMIDFGFDKIALIGAVALIVIGPEKLPRVARTVGHLLGKAQRYVADVKAEVNRSIELEELKKMKTSSRTRRATSSRRVSSEIHQTTRRPRARPGPTDDAAAAARQRPARRAAAAAARVPAPEEELAPEARRDAAVVQAAQRHARARRSRARRAWRASGRRAPRLTCMSVDDNGPDELEGTEQPFVSHLVELRDRLIRALDRGRRLLRRAGVLARPGGAVRPARRAAGRAPAARARR